MYGSGIYRIPGRPNSLRHRGAVTSSEIQFVWSSVIKIGAFAPVLPEGAAHLIEPASSANCNAKKMKTALIAGVCLLLLTFTITDAMRLAKKQSVECLNPSNDAVVCLAAVDETPIDKGTVCTSRCRSALEEYLMDCLDVSKDEFDEGYSEECSAAGTVVTLFSLVSAVLLAVGS